MIEGMLAGQYRIVQKLGEGATGAVYLAEHVKLGRRAALKVLNRSFSNDPDMLARFKREAVVAASILHPNVCAIYDFGETSDGLAYLAMAYVEGRSLQEILHEAGGRLPPERAAGITVQVALGLQAAHDMAVVHRDLKPGNIMITSRSDGSDAVTIVDFGIAKLAGEAATGAEVTRTGIVVGTPEYMSPEQLMGDRLGPQSDIYSFALLVFRMLSGRLPFERAGVQEAMIARLTDKPDRISDILPGVPLVATQLVLERALERDASRRHTSAREFGEAVAAAIKADLSSSATRPDGSLRARGLLARLSGWLSSRTGSTAADSAAVADESARQDTPVGTLDDGSQAPSDPGAQRPTTVPPAGPPVDDGHTRLLNAKDWAPPIPAGSAAGPGEFTRMFAVPSTGPTQLEFAVAVTVTTSADPALVGMRVRCDRFPFVIGRSNDADLPLAGDQVLSRQHVAIDRDERGFVVRDLSTNGIYVNGRLVRGRSEPLYFGSPIFLSKTTSITFLADIPPLPDHSGQHVESRFALERILHRSVKAVTYLAHDVRVPQRALAIKVFSPSLMHLGHYRAEFERQARMAAALVHPHICKVLEFGETALHADAHKQTYSYICMEFMGGGNLEDRLRADSQLDVRQIATWVRTLAGALESAHRHGVIHGDLKPGCIVFDREGNPYLTDFALARSGESDASAHVIGTPAFLAPEQWDGAPSSTATDLYSFAALVYLMVTGVRPHEGQSMPEVRQRNFRRGPAPAHEEASRAGRRDVSPAVSDVLARALSVDPASRFASVLEFGEEFVRAATDPAPRVARPHIFLSYQRQASAAWAILFARALEEHHDCTVFLDTQAQDGAPQIPDRIRTAIRTCDVFVCLLAPDTLRSDWVQQEIEIASHFHKPMVPVFHEDFRPKDERNADAPAVRALLEFDAVILFDRRNVYVDHTITDLGARIRRLI